MKEKRIEKAICKAQEKACVLGAELSLSANDFIDDNHLNCIWYNGIIGTISISGYTVSIEVHGDISLTVLSEDLSKEMDGFSFKNGRVAIEDEAFTAVIPNDEALQKFSQSGRIIWHNNNWVEYVVLDKDNREISSFIQDNTVLDDDILAAFDDIGYYIDHIKQITNDKKEAHYRNGAQLGKAFDCLTG